MRNETKTEVAVIPDVVDATLDLIECKVGRMTQDGEIVKDGQYNACFPKGEDTGRDAARELCYLTNNSRAYENRIHNYPAPGHELWSCSDINVMQQMVAANVLDYLIGHRDRFYSYRTNNLFFLKHQHPLQFVSIDHDSSHQLRLFRDGSYEEWTPMQILLDYNLPHELKRDLQKLCLRDPKEDFVRNFNASIYGQLDNLTRILGQFWSDSLYDDVRDKVKSAENNASLYLVTALWRRLGSVVDFYNITMNN